MAPYVVPDSAEGRLNDLKENIEIYNSNYEEFREKCKKAAGLRAKKALTVIKKLATDVRRDIQAQIDLQKKS